MAKTLAQVQKQIEALQKEAADIKSKEIPGVISRIKEAIKHYGLTAADLGFKVAASKASKPAGKSAAKYADGAGNTWSGRGPRPAWLRAALEQGKALTDFVNGSSGGASSVGKGRKATVAKAPKVKYADGTGKTWSGRGPKPAWFKEALAQGKQPADLLAK